MNIRIGIGFNSPDITTEALSQLPAVAATVEDLGFDSLWTTERVACCRPRWQVAMSR
jgi:alkanesulfonate monooxygenase SsuD/methylene tetrahydromethanopterin reductase-like flavin-dependent oxidoreductase (luciferase family)